MSQYSPSDLVTQWQSLSPVFSAPDKLLTPAQRALKADPDFSEVCCAFDQRLDLNDKRNRGFARGSLRRLLNMMAGYVNDRGTEVDVRVSRTGKPLTQDARKLMERAEKNGLHSTWSLGTTVKLMKQGLAGYLRDSLSAGVSKRLSAVIIPHSPQG